MPSSGMLRRVALVRTDLSGEHSASIIRVTRIGEIGRTLAVFLCSVRRLLVTASVLLSSPNLVTLMIEALSSSETSVLTRATRRNIQEHTILHSHRRKNLRSYTVTEQIIKMFYCYALSGRRERSSTLSDIPLVRKRESLPTTAVRLKEYSPNVS
jgi:hypothetical protein